MYMSAVTESFLFSVSFQVGTLVVGYALAVAFKWTPGMEGYLRTMSVPIWVVLIFYLGKSGTVHLGGERRDSETEEKKKKHVQIR